MVLSELATFSVVAFGQESQAHSPGAQGQTSVLPPQLQVVFSVPGTFFKSAVVTFALGQELQAQCPGAQGQASVLPPQLHVVLSVPGTCLRSDLDVSVPEQLHLPFSHEQVPESECAPHLQVVLSAPVAASPASCFFKSAKRRASA